MAQIGDKIKIVRLCGEFEDSPFHGLEGTVTRIKEAGQMYGTWGMFMVDPDIDEFIVLPKENLKE